MKNIKSSHKVRVFISEMCPYCVTLKIFLEKNNIPFEEVDVTKNQAAQKEMIEKSGQMGLPVVEIDDEIVVGFDKEKICKLLEIKD